MGRSDGKRPFGRPGHDGMIILKCIFKSWVEEAGRDYSCSGKVGGR